MAYMSQEKKAKIAANLKKVMPKDWKYSLAVHHHSTIILTISAAPVDLIAHFNETCQKAARHSVQEFTPAKDYIQVNEFYLNTQFSGDVLAAFEKIKDAMNTDNFDRSDIQSDYFCVGHWVNIHIGKWDKPFQFIAPRLEPTYEELRAKIAALEAQAV